MEGYERKEKEGRETFRANEINEVDKEGEGKEKVNEKARRKGDRNKRREEGRREENVNRENNTMTRIYRR